jgi:hypothetical protein
MTIETLAPSFLGHDAGSNPLAPANALIDRLQALDPECQLGDAEYRTRVLMTVTPYEALAALQEVNTTLYGRENPVFHSSVNLGMGEGMDCRVGFVGLHPEYGRELFDYAFSTSQRLLYDQGPAALETVGEIMAGTIVGTQMFKDGNKRTARAAYLLATRGYDGSPQAQEEYGRYLGYTYEARNSMSFNPHHSATLRSFCLEGLDPDDMRAVMRFEDAWQFNQPSRQELDDLMSAQIQDPELRRVCINVLQQNSFGTEALVSLIGHVPVIKGGFVTPKSAAPVVGAAKAAIARLTPEIAQKVIDNDSGRKKELMVRLIDSTSRQNPLPIVDYHGVADATTAISISGATYAIH